MLQIKNISKTYITGELKQKALDEVSLNLRDNEFVAILGPSGSGKTTLLNVIGGLDRYDGGPNSGDLVINGISTKKYKDKDWDSYRNHTIGFIFQSYNLISHQSLLANVELALTISGVSSAERKKRAIEALTKVGLGEQIHKKPNQLSGGQMQRVAIARALVNDPKILLADEPTGALDSETSIQVMDLLKEVAQDRLVVMVTHNPELADKYATRIVHLQDGKIVGDSNPYEISEQVTEQKAVHKNMGKTSMSRLTALSLSFNNLLTKKGRTLMTAFAGSIGIIGIALILSLSAGVNTYIDDLQKNTMTAYPVTIETNSMDLSSLLTTVSSETSSSKVDHELDGVYSNPSDIKAASTVALGLQTNNLTAFKKYLDDPESEINKYLGENGIVYSYNTNFGVYTYDEEGAFVNTDGSTLNKSKYGSGAMSVMSAMSSSLTSENCMEELLPGKDGNLVSQALMDSYDLLYGTWPQNYDEVVLVVDKNNEISTSTLYKLGLMPASKYRALMKQIDSGEEVKLETTKFGYEDICKQSLILIPACDTYVEDSNGLYECIAEDETAMKKVAESALKLKIVGVIRPTEDADFASLVKPLAYTSALIDYLIDYCNNSAVVKAQMANPERNILNGADFVPVDDEAKAETARNYLSNMSVEEKAEFCRSMFSQLGMLNEVSAGSAGISGVSGNSGVSGSAGVSGVSGNSGVSGSAESAGSSRISGASGISGSAGVSGVSGVAGSSRISGASGISGSAGVSGVSGVAGSSGISGASGISGEALESEISSQVMNLSDNQLAQILDLYLQSGEVDTSELLLFYDTYINAGSYEDNLQVFGYISEDSPTSISLYADSFEDKDAITACIKAYNDAASKDDKISYTDYVGLLMSSVTTIVNIISYVLIAFVAVSLVVSSIMIGIITYISVLERTKEIGILRALGASKRNVSQVFKAETFIIGLCSGVIGVGITLLLLIPGNAVIHALAKTTDISAGLPVGSAVVLIILSVLLTSIGGRIPAKKASKKDPVAALRAE